MAKEAIDLANIKIKNKAPASVNANSSQVHISQPTFEPPAEKVLLPSKGLLYKDVTDDEDLLQGYIKIRPMTLNEEKILTTTRLVKTGQAIELVFRNCIKSNIDPRDLLSSDRLFLMFWLRGISYGHQYTFTLRCPSATCGRQFKYTIDISKQPIKEIDPDISEPIELELPKTKAIIYYRLPRGRDEEQLRRLEEKAVGFNDIDNTTTERLKILIERIITPDGSELPKEQWDAFLNSLIAYDSAYIRQDMISKDAGIEPIKNVICPYCDEQFEEDIPITVDFFRVSR